MGEGLRGTDVPRRLLDHRLGFPEAAPGSIQMTYSKEDPAGLAGVVVGGIACPACRPWPGCEVGATPWRSSVVPLAPGGQSGVVFLLSETAGGRWGLLPAQPPPPHPRPFLYT